MTDSRVPDVLDALVAMFTTALAPLQDGTGLPAVLDGPMVQEEPRRYVVIGDEGEDEPSETPFERNWAGLGAQAMDELAQIPCAAIAWAGNADTSARRQEAFAIFTACEAEHRADLNLGGLVLFSRITDGAYRPYSNSSGSGARVRFTIEYKARI